MSVFDFPRVNVAGTYLVDPPTGNNDVPPAAYLSDNGLVAAITGPMHDEEFTKMSAEGLSSQLTKLDKRFDRMR